MSICMPDHLRKALYIRRVEEILFALYEQGYLSGTIHACIGQELSALAVCGQLNADDFVFSNHRCHGHFLALTGDARGLIAELMGKTTGVSGGVGGSQHLFVKDRFYSNGIQGGIAPVAAGRAMSEKMRGSGNIGVVFIGDGTLGEGVVYETLNIISKWRIPLLVVVEDNLYAQSTSQLKNLAGSIDKRFESFGIPVFESSTSDWEGLSSSARGAIRHVRSVQSPAVQIIHTYRLCPHSKSDDCRNQTEVDEYCAIDALNCFSREFPEVYAEERRKIDVQLSSLVDEVKKDSVLSLAEYEGYTSNSAPCEWNKEAPKASSQRFVEVLNSAFHDIMRTNDDVIFLGEDIHSPYGGAFKATKGLSDAYPDRVFTTPISEQAIMGIANGLALGGYRPIVEFMFGDFTMLAMDQIVNHASKFHHMYNRGVSCPVVVRTPMGGHRGYGPTHSQTLDKFLAGIDNVTVVALNQLVPPDSVYKHITTFEPHPHIVIENKIDYTRRANPLRHGLLANYTFIQSKGPFPAYRIEPVGQAMDVCIVTYGGNVEMVFEAMNQLFMEHEILAGAIILTKIHPINPHELFAECSRVFVVEEGSLAYGFGSEVLALLAESGRRFDVLRRIGSRPVPIPATRELEEEVLATVRTIVTTISEALHE